MPLHTEAPHPLHPDLDLYTTAQLVQALVDDQLEAVRAVRASSAALVAAIDAALPRLVAGGRLIYVGAGTSGRLALQDAVELNPTFSWPHERAIALLAGGSQAVFRAIENAEDRADMGEADMRAVSPAAQDVVLALAASGSTPYVLGAVAEARRAGALVIGLANNAGSPLAAQADIGITLDTGSEIISGSTRLKAGTAQKITLNTLSSALMVGLNKVYGNLMVDLRATNAKLRRRALVLTMRASGAPEQQAAQVLSACDHRIKQAVVALKLGVTPEVAQARLDAAQGSVRRALG